MSCYARSPITSNGICADGLNPCCSTTRTRTAPRRPAPRWSRPRKSPNRPQRKARSKRTANGLPVHSFQTLLADLATVAKNQVVPRLPGAQPFTVVTRPTALQSEAFRLLGVRLKRTQ